MAKLRVAAFSISLDGYGAGLRQSVEHPLGVGGEPLHKWILATRTFHEMTGAAGGETGIDDQFVARSLAGIGAWILGRNMFGPVRGPWRGPADSWRGWWGENPPYHVPVFVLTHYARQPLEMEGGTVFHFVTGGIHDAFAQATAAAGGKDVRLGGGVATIRAYLQAGLVDEMHLAIVPALLGSGESLLGGLDLPALGYACAEHVPAAAATHVTLKKRRTPR